MIDISSDENNKFNLLKFNERGMHRQKKKELEFEG